MSNPLDQGPPHHSIIAFCESFLEKYGDTELGVGWPREDAEVRYRVMLDLLRPSSSPVTVLDFGCGTSRLYEYIRSEGYAGIIYSGLDLSDSFLKISKDKFPDINYYSMDLLEQGTGILPRFDYVVMNGIFNYKGGFPYG